MVIIGHRGSHGPGGATENTVEAFEAAVREGADLVELDVWRAADDTLWVWHDDTLAAATAGRESRGVHQMTAPELRRIELPRGGRLPTLDEAFDVLARRIAVNVEIKHGAALLPALRTIAAREVSEQVILSSFDHSAIEAAATEAPEVARALIMGTESLNPRARFRESYPFWALRRARASFWHPHHLLCHPPLIEALHRTGVRVNVWTVNDPTIADLLGRMGADGIFTDRPGWMRARLLG